MTSREDFIYTLRTEDTIPHCISNIGITLMAYPVAYGEKNIYFLTFFISLLEMKFL